MTSSFSIPSDFNGCVAAGYRPGIIHLPTGDIVISMSISVITLARDISSESTHGLGCPPSIQNPAPHAPHFGHAQYLSHSAERWYPRQNFNQAVLD